MNYGVVFRGVDRVTAEQVDEPDDPSYGQVLLTTLYCGLCGSDLHLLKSGEIGVYTLEKPLVIGHEAVARVTKVGPGVANLQENDLVTCEPALPCLSCVTCLTGNYHLCPQSTEYLCGMPHTDGFLRKRFTHPAIFCHKLPDDLDKPIKGSLCEPLSVAIHSVRRAKLQPGMDVLITGAGAIGLLSLLVARHFGAKTIVVVDINEDRLKVAKELGADYTYLAEPKVPGNVIQLAFQLKTKLARGGVDRVFECTGSEDGTKLAIECALDGGKVVATGLGPPEIKAPLAKASVREVDILGVCRYKAGCFDLAISLLDKLNLDPIINNVYPYTKIVEAFDALAKGKGIKITIDMSYEDDTLADKVVDPLGQGDGCDE